MINENKIINILNNIPENDTVIAKCFEDICLYSKLSTEVTAPDFPRPAETHNFEQKELLKEAARMIHVARAALDTINDFCVTSNIEPIIDTDLSRPEQFKTYADFIADTINSITE